MRDLLIYTKTIRDDFPFPNEEYDSKVDLAITSLISGDYHKSNELFDEAIEIDKNYSAAWVGKVFTAIASTKSDNFDSLVIEDYLDRIDFDGNKKYKHLISACIINKYSNSIEMVSLKIEEALSKGEEAEIEIKKTLSMQSDTKVISQKKWSRIPKKLYGEDYDDVPELNNLDDKNIHHIESSILIPALSHIFQSIPHVKICNSSLDSIVDENFRNALIDEIDSWKRSIANLLNLEKSILVSRLNSIDFFAVAELEEFVYNYDEEQQINEFIILLEILNMGDHKLFELVNKLEANVERYFGDDKTKRKLQRASKRQAYSVYGAIGVIIFSVLFSFLTVNFFFGVGLDTVAIFFGFILVFIMKPWEMKKFAEKYSSILTEIESIKLDKNEIYTN